MRKWLALLLLVPGLAWGKVLVVSDATTAATYTLGSDPRLDTEGQVAAVCALLDRWGASYKVLSPKQAKTEFCRTGLVYYRTIGNFGYDTAGPSEQFDAVIHCAFNGGSASQFTGYRPDSLTLNADAPTVPQLMLLADHLMGGEGVINLNQSATDSCGVVNSGYQSAGAGSGNHEGEGTVFNTLGPERWFDACYGASILRGVAPAGGTRVIMGSGMNSVFNTIERTGLMTSDPDSVGTAVTDTMKVWEKLNSHRANLSRVVFATAFQPGQLDSAAAAGSNIPNTYGSTNWPVLICAVAHLDSLAGGAVLGTKKIPAVGIVITHVGDRAARQHPGGAFGPDSTFIKQSCDSLAYYGIKVVAAADPESLSANAADASWWKRIGNVRFSPFVRRGLDTLALAASSNAGDPTSPVDVWGRFRNRAFYGDSVFHSVAGSDSSITAQLVSAKNLLATAVGRQYLSSTVIAPSLDFSPYQMRAGQNANRYDSLMFAIRKAGFSTLIARTQGKDSDPQYLKTNPVGWLNRERSYRIQAASLLGERINILGVSTIPVWGSSKFIVPSVTDTTAPYCDVTCPAADVSVAHEARFWEGFFTPDGQTAHSTVSSWDAHDVFTTDQGVYLDSRDRLYGQARASICVLPAQSFGGGAIEIGYAHTEVATTYPTHPGWLIAKHLAAVVKAANRLAGRTIMLQSYPEDIQP